MKYKCRWFIDVDVEAENEEEARKKCADKLSDDFFSWICPEDVEIIKQEERRE